MKFMTMQTPGSIEDLYEPLPKGSDKNKYPVLEWELEGRDEGGMPLSKEELTFLYEVASWKRGAPPIEDGARRANLRRREALQIPGWPAVHGVQMKGVGFRKVNEITQPTAKQPYKPGALPSVKALIGRDGKTQLQLPVVEALGGWTMGAKNEFTNLVALNRAGIPAVVPIRYGTLPDETWQGKALELGIWGLPTKETRRIGNQLQSWIDSPSTIEKSPLSVDDIPEFVLHLSQKIAKMVSRIQREAGVVSLQPHSGNFTYDFDTEALVAHDFETAKRTTELTSVQAGIYTLMDVTFFLRKAIMTLVKLDYSQFKLTDNLIEETFKSALDSFYEGQDSTKREFVEQMKKLVLLMRIALQNPNPDIFFELLMNRTFHIMLPRLCELHQKSEVGKQYVIPMSPNEVALDYASFEAMCFEFGNRMTETPAIYFDIFKPTHRPQALQRVLKEIEAMRDHLTPQSPPPTRI